MEDHKVFKSKGNTQIFAGDLTKCIEKVGSPVRLGQLLNIIWLREGKAFDKVRDASVPGRYILGCLPQWLKRYGDELVPVDFVSEESE